MAFTLPDEGYVTLHSAECYIISQARTKGAYTRRNYGKHCAETWEDVEKFRERPDARVEECRRCPGMRDRSKKRHGRPGYLRRTEGQATTSYRTPPATESPQAEKLESTSRVVPTARSTSDVEETGGPVSPADFRAIADFCRHNLDLDTAEELQGNPYQCVPVCVIDAVFSIGVRYEGTEAVIRRFCHHFQIPYSGPNRLPPQAEQLSIDAFLRIYDRYGVPRMTSEVYQNRQRTSSRSGILKSEAVLRFSLALAKHSVNYLQDVEKVIGSRNFEADIKQIPGQSSGISLRYFFMLAGSDDYVKPDRMIHRFLHRVLGRVLTDDGCQEAVVGACGVLVAEYPVMSPKALDHLIWRYERGK